MQTKTIRKAIEKKLTEWIESISDEDLRKALYKNVLVSGGSITSMFLNIEVNDFDVYIKDRGVLMNTVRYYTKRFTQDIEILDGNFIETYEKEKELIALSEAGIVNINFTAARVVAIKNLQPGQIKLFIKAKSGGLKVEEAIVADESTQAISPKYQPRFFSPNAISLSDKIQIVIRFYGNAEEIHKTFDFIHATNYFTFDEGLVTNKEALESILTKQLRYQGSLYPLTTIIRIRKFLARGWKVSAGELLKVMFQISEFDLHNPDVLEEQIIGVDVAYFSKLIEVLRGVKRESITSEYLNTLIDRVFNGGDEEE